MEIRGHVTDVEGRPVEGADVLAQSEGFDVIATTTTGADGDYALAVDLDRLPHLVIVKGWGETGLELWGTDLAPDDGAETITVDAVIDTLEVYRLTAFRVEHGAMVWFRPMALDLAQEWKAGRRGIGDIAPEIDWERTWFEWDGARAPVVAHQRVTEQLPDGSAMTAVLAQVDLAWTPGRHRLRVHVVDRAGHVGEAVRCIDIR